MNALSSDVLFVAVLFS